MQELKNKELYSQDLQEIMSDIPGALLKYGLLIIFITLLILVIIGFLIKSPEIVTVQVEMITNNPPVSLVAKTNGEIKNLYINEGSIILKNHIAAIIKSTIDYNDIQKLQNYLELFENNSDWIELLKKMPSPPNLILAEIQPNYSRLQKEWKQFREFLDKGYISTKLNLLEQQLQIKNEYNLELAKQFRFLTEGVFLSMKSFERDSILFHNSNYSISLTEYEKSRQEYVQKLYSYSVFNASLKNNAFENLRLRETKVDLIMQYEKELKQYILNIEETIQLLKSAISEWEEKYLIKSLISGKATLTHLNHVNQIINSGETLAIIIPDSINNIFVSALIPISDFGRIEIGQKVNIKLSGFPYLKYGVLKGSIFSLSQYPKDGFFIANIKLIEGLTTSYQEKIKFIQKMNGQADIIIEHKSLISKLLKPLNGLKEKLSEL